MREDRAFYNAAGDPYVFPTDAFVGRARELVTLRDALDAIPSRLIAVLGTAGVGKTRLALEAVRTADERYPGGAVVVRLAAIERVADIMPEIARAIGMIDQAEKLDGLVREALAQEPAVLLLDCFEHLTPAANALVAGLLNDCPELRIVLTSRRSSGLPGEWRVELLPLPVASDGSVEAALRSEAVQLFINRAAHASQFLRSKPVDPLIANELCARYDGLPLAIELLASWVTVLSPRQLLDWRPDELEFRMPVLDPRHQSLMDAIAWSFGLLQPDEQALLCRLAIFSGGFSRDLVETMARGRDAGAGYPYCDGYNIPWPFDLDGLGNPTLHPQDPAISQAVSTLATDPVRLLATLIDHRLVYQVGEIDGVPRFDMLEAIREFGQRQLERTGQTAAIRHAHAAAMIAFSEASSEGSWHKESRFWGRERVDADLQNIRAALAWAATLGDDGAVIATRIAGPLWNYWQTRGLVTEGRRYLDDWLFRPGLKEWCRSKELPGLAFLCWIQGDDEHCQQVVDVALEVTERTGVVSSRAMVFLVMSLLEFRRGLENVVTMMAHVEEAERLFRIGGDDNGRGACYLVYGQVCRLTGDTQRALELFEDARQLLTETGYEWGVAASRYFAAEAMRDLAEDDRGRVPDAVALLHESLERFWSMGDYWGAGGAMSGLACILAMQGVNVQAATYFGASSVLMGRVGGSLLPSELMTHQETEAELQARMPAREWHEAFAAGANEPDRMVEQALADALVPPSGPDESEPALPKLTRTQLQLVRDLVNGYDIPRIAHRRGRSLSATYELADRIADRLGLDHRDEIARYVVRIGLVDPPIARPGFDPPK